MRILHDDGSGGKLLLVRVGSTVDVLRPGQSMEISAPTDHELTITVQHGIPTAETAR